MRKLIGLALVFLIAPALQAQSVKFEKTEVAVNPGGIALIVPIVDGGPPKWRADPAVTEFDLEKLFGPQIAAQAKGRVYIAPLAPGRYKVESWCGKENLASEIATCWLVVGNPPDPGPGPKPPDPKPPDPKPPGPDNKPSVLTAKLQAAYTADTSAPSVKAGAKVMLQGLYEAMIDHSRQPAITTTGELLSDMKKVAEKMIAPGALIEVRKVISAEIATSLGTNPDLKLDPDLRPRAIEVFTRIAKSLSEVK